MDIKIIFLIIALLIIIGFMLIKSVTKLMKVSFIIVFIVFLLIYLTSSIAFEKQVVDLTKASGIAKATKIYFLWVFSNIQDLSSITGKVVKNTSINKTNESKS